jgi:hypothetical protein
LLAQLLGIETPSGAVTYVIAFAIIFALLTLLALVLRRLTGRRAMLSGQGGRTRQPRLGIVDVYDLDRQRQLILLRRDNVEHLLLIGGPNDVVIETNIVRVPGAGARPQATPEFPERLEERPPEAVPARPVVEALPLRAANEGGERRGTVTALPTEAATASASMQPNPARGEAVLKPDVVALQGGRAAPRRPEAPPPAPARETPRPEAPRRSAPIPPALSEATPPKPAPQPSPSPISEPQGPDAVILSDMAKQLEEALKRPAAPVKPPEPAPVPPSPSPPPQSPMRAEAPPARAPVPPPARPPVPPPARPPAPPPASPPPRPAQAEPAPKPPSPPPQPQPAPRPAQPAPNGPVAEAPAPPKPPRPEPAAAKPETRPEPPPEAPPRVSDPFSVEEIEAEFARLLGRPFDKNDKGDKV